MYTVATRAGVSESVFYELFPTVDGMFPTVEQCYCAAFEQGLGRLSQAVVQATAREQAWLERVRSGLVALLGFFDDEPSWARLLLLDASVAGTQVLRCEQRLLGVMTRLLEAANPQALRAPAPVPQMTAELVAGGTFAVIRARALEDSDVALVELAPSLMAFIVRPYLGDVAARAELEGRPARSGEALATEPNATLAQTLSRAAELPIRPTQRTTLVLRAIAQMPYSNNREVAQAAGLSDEGQASKLLTRLECRGVIENVGMGAARGAPNAWLLTGEGRRVLALLGESFGQRAPRRASRRLRRAV
jgi:AcrR family transcriptional regulator